MIYIDLNELSTDEAIQIVNNHIHKNLIELMETTMIMYVDATDIKYTTEEEFFNNPNNLKPLRTSLDFANYISMYFPYNFAITKRMNTEFFKLYDMLKDTKQYTLPIIQSYILYAILDEDFEDSITEELISDYYFEEFGVERDNIEYNEKIFRLNDVDRNKVKNALIDYATELLEDLDEPNNAKIEDVLEDLVYKYESIESYKEICFEDYDFDLLNSYTLKQLKNSPISKKLGINF